MSVRFIIKVYHKGSHFANYEHNGSMFFNNYHKALRVANTLNEKETNLGLSESFIHVVVPVEYDSKTKGYEE